eukprot:scaffold25722_cov109-Isochrysis_galbana.AAC.13
MGDPRATPKFAWRASSTRCSGCRRISVLTIIFGNSGLTTTWSALQTGPECYLWIFWTFVGRATAANGRHAFGRLPAGCRSAPATGAPSWRRHSPAAVDCPAEHACDHNAGRMVRAQTDQLDAGATPRETGQRIPQCRSCDATWCMVCVRGAQCGR